MNILTSKYFRFSIIAVFILLFVWILVRNSWVCDDAYISFRVVDNFIHGYGLNWNAVERVQVYTNPLWTFLFTVPYLFTREAFFTSISFSLLVSLVTVIVFAFRWAKSMIPAIIGIITMIFSKSFLEFSSSGLENPLTHLLLLIFLIIFYKADRFKNPLLILSIIAAYAMLNRMDTLLFFIPALIYYFWKHRSARSVRNVLLGFSPIILWLLFCTFYYGSPFPNTVLAKLNVMLSISEFIKQGWHYFAISTRTDPLTSLIIAAGMSSSFVFGHKEEKLISIGIILYLLYLLRIGGDFMVGRMLTPVFFCSLLTLVRMVGGISGSARKHIILSIATVIIVAVGLGTGRSPLFIKSGYGKNLADCILGEKIVDEKCWYFQEAGLINYSRGRRMPDHDFRIKAERNSDRVTGSRSIGYYGYFSGPNVYVVDYNALADPLLSRIPLITDTWRIGHFERRTPDGYPQTLRSGFNLISNNSLEKYYDKIRLVTRGKLFSWERIKAVVTLNLGGYDYLLKEYIACELQKTSEK